MRSYPCESISGKVELRHHSDSVSLLRNDFKRVCGIFSTASFNLAISVRSDAPDVVSLLDGCQPPTVQNLLGIFQIVISPGQFHFKKLPVVLVREVISFRWSKDQSICVPECIDNASAVLQIATGETLRLNDQHTFNLTALKVFHDALHNRTVRNGFPGNNFPKNPFFRNAGSERGESIVLELPLMSGKDFFHSHIRII